MKLQFTGHESFICKQLWLKKGYDFVKNKGDFNNEAAVIELGVGKNMVASVSYWLKAFGITDPNNNISEFGNFLFDDEKGVDPYIEDIATIWLLHYNLNKIEKASIYSLFFNEFRKGRPDFTKSQLLNFIKLKLEQSDQKGANENTVLGDINVFIRNYLKPTSKETKIDIEEDFSSLMIDLDLMQSFKSEDSEGKITDWYKAENKIQIDLPENILLFALLDNNTYGNSINFREILNGLHSPGTIFLLNEVGLLDKLTKIANIYDSITYSETAGVREIQFKSKPNKWKILNDYYTK